MCLCVRFILHYSIVLLILYYSIALSEELRYVYGFAPYIYHFDWLIDSCPRLGFAGEGASISFPPVLILKLVNKRETHWSVCFHIAVKCHVSELVNYKNYVCFSILDEVGQDSLLRSEQVS